MRYIIGIDLGTTNSCVAYVDTEGPKQTIQLFRIPQMSSKQHVEELETLPSFCYLDPEHNCIVGDYAKHQAARIPTRVVESAKSWLCLSGTNRRDNILPLIAESHERKMSPVAATSAYLAHIRDAWNQKMSKGDLERELEQQHIVLTVPASFDEVARELTFEAAKKAGFVHVTLLEEPQAAFYSWINEHDSRWQEIMEPGQSILVCDIGGGTTDFSYIEVTESGFRRMAVGNHLLLGGDNMDHAVAHYLESKLDAKLSNTQWQQLRHEARLVKERVLNGEEKISVCIQGSGSSVVGGSLACEVKTQEVRELLINGFWRQDPWEQAIQMKRRGGVRSFGLPYEEEPAILKHLASFLHQHHLRSPDYVLFNGGTMTPGAFQESVINACSAWFPGKQPQVLKTCSLDLAVARGAAYYGKVRFGDGIKISGGISRAYYIEVVENKEKKVLTLVPREAEEGSQFDLNRTFFVQPNTPVSFRVYSSHVRIGDQLGQLIEVNEEELQALPAIHTTIRYGKTTEKIPVHVVVKLTEIGTLELWLQSQTSDHKWKLEFQLQSATGHESLQKPQYSQSDELVDKALLNEAEAIILTTFRSRPKEIIPRLEEIIQKSRNDWGPSVLRGLWSALMEVSDTRKVSLEHQMRWWHLAGYLLRPGFGVALDDHRIKELWKIILSDYRAADFHHWICYRRVAGGLNKGQQRQIAPELMKDLLTKGKIHIKSKRDLYPYSEKIRALAAFEYLDVGTKIKLGNAVVQKINSGKGADADYWALGRIGARQLLYGAVVDVVAKETCERWVRALLESQHTDLKKLEFLFGQLARETECREVNLDLDIVKDVKKRFPTLDLSFKSLKMVDQSQLYGDQLPAGLMVDL